MSHNNTISAATERAAPMRYRAHSEVTKPACRARLLADADEILSRGLTLGAREEETTLFKALHACAYLIEQNAAKESEDHSAGAWEAKFQQIADTLVNANLGLVYEMRKRSGVRDVDSDEMNSTGMWSLYQAVLGFDPWRGYRFSTYACNILVRAYRHLWRRGMRQTRHLQNFQTQRTQRAETDGRFDPDRALLRDRLSIVLEQNAAKLTATERYIIERRFLNDATDRPETLAKVGKAISLGKERVRQIQVIALGKLAGALRADPVLRAAQLV